MRLPEPETLLALQRSAASAYGVGDPSMVVAAPGTQILISLLPHLLGVKSATILGPTYSEHQAAWEAAGAHVGMEQETDAFMQTAGMAGGVAILCNPNNPDGRRCPAGMLLELSERLSRRGGMLICDEAFADLESPDPGLASSLPHPGLLILRSFGKSYGLAGLRLGFLLASPQTAARIRTALGPWAVSGPALAAGTAALADARWRETMRERLRQSGDRLDGMLAASGLTLVGGTSLFRSYRGTDAQSIFTGLGEAGILVRRFDHDAGLLRLGIPGALPHWTRLRSALSACAAGAGPAES